MCIRDSGSSIPSFTSFIALLGPFVGLSLGFDAINSERSEEMCIRDSIRGVRIAGKNVQTHSDIIRLHCWMCIKYLQEDWPH